MPNKIRDDLPVVSSTSFPYILEQDVTIKLKTFDSLVRYNIYRPNIDEKVLVLVTYVHGKDIYYKEYVGSARYLVPGLRPIMQPG